LHLLVFVVPSFFLPSFRERDSDKDGKVNFQEFFHGLFDSVRNYDEEGHNSSHLSDDSVEAPAKKLFNELDKDADGYFSGVLCFFCLYSLTSNNISTNGLEATLIL
jgi:Ca2+-binding EF-hand superfamily protein